MTPGPPVGQMAARAAVWAFVSIAGAKLITLAGLLVLARILAPAEFGLLAFALVYMTYAETIGDLGTAMALIYWPDRRDDAAQITFFMNLAAGTFWCLSTIVLAPLIAGFFNSPQGTAIIQVLAVSFIIRYLGNTHDALAQKDLRFRTRVVPELALAVVKAGVAIALAYNGFGVWSLVFGHIAGLACWTMFLWILVPWRPSRRFPRDLAAPMLRYGRGIIAVNVLAAIVHHSDLVIVGRFLGATALGLYQMAQKISEATIIVLLWAVAKVLFPAFSRIHAEGRELKAPYLFATRCVSAITFPAAVGLALVARPLVLVVLGPTWIGAAPILTALAAYAGIRSLSNHGGDVLKATGRAHFLAGIAAAKAVVLIPALVIAATRDAATVAMALAAVELLFAAVTLTIVSRLIEVPLLAVGRAFLPAAAAVSAMAAYLVLWRGWAAPLGPLAELAGAIAGGGLIYLAVLRLIDRKIIEWVWQTLLRRKTAEPGPVAGGATT